MSNWRDRAWSLPLEDATYRAEVWNRLIANVCIDETTGCWEWQRYRNPQGYGTISIKRRMVGAHQVALAISRGDIWPALLQIDHLCRNRSCCNPEHLELVTTGENSKRGLGGVLAGIRQRRKTHCPKGHPYDETNTYVRPGGGHRRCRTCRREGMREAYRAGKYRSTDEQKAQRAAYARGQRKQAKSGV